ncbi:hypothetical protein FPOAC2_03729 [Fusarium poae]
MFLAVRFSHTLRLWWIAVGLAHDFGCQERNVFCAVVLWQHGRSGCPHDLNIILSKRSLYFAILTNLIEQVNVMLMRKCWNGKNKRLGHEDSRLMQSTNASFHA